MNNSDKSHGHEPTKVLLDTDMAKDVDDVGALATLHALADLGEAEILGVLVSCANPFSAPCVSSVNTWYGRKETPVGVVRGGVVDPSLYAEQTSRELPGPINHSDQAEDAVRLARRVLAHEADQSVVLISIGFMTNFWHLLESAPDDLSPLTGRELAGRKISHWVCMGGKFPEGAEFNLTQHPEASAAVFSEWKSPITLLGVELGYDLLTGRRLSETPGDNPVRRAYEHYYGGEPQDRYSWDQATVLYAIRGLRGELEDYWELSPPGTLLVRPDGTNFWRNEPAGKHRYLREKMDPKEISAVIEELMIRPAEVREEVSQ